MDKTSLAFELNEVSQGLMDLYVDLAKTAIDEVNAEEELETAKAKAVISGEVYGKNEEERKARTSILLSVEIAKAREAGVARVKKHYHVKALESRRDSLIAILNSLT